MAMTAVANLTKIRQLLVVDQWTYRQIGPFLYTPPPPKKIKEGKKKRKRNEMHCERESERGFQFRDRLYTLYSWLSVNIVAKSEVVWSVGPLARGLERPGATRGSSGPMVQEKQAQRLEAEKG